MNLKGRTRMVNRQKHPTEGSMAPSTGQELTATDAASQSKPATASNPTLQVLRPSVSSAIAMNEYMGLHDVDIGAMVDQLDKGIAQMLDGDMRDAESMLYGQAQVLQIMFMDLARRAAHQSEVKHKEAYMRMGLKAQSQCRITLETLATIKNPPLVIARQANISHGPQQVNNGVAPGARATASTRSRARNSQSVQNELLEADGEQRLDSRATRAPSRADPSVVALDQVHRPAPRGRKGAIGAERLQG